MPSQSSSFGFEMSVRHSGQGSSPRAPDVPFTLLVLGDFSGRASRGVVEPLVNRRLLNVDIDTFETIFAKLGAQLHLTGNHFPGGELDLAIRSFEDFHPDQLLRQIPWLTELKEARRLLQNADTAEQGREALEASLGSSPPPPSSDTVSDSSPETASESDEDTFAQLLGEPTPPQKPQPQPPSPASPLDDLIQKAVAPHLDTQPATWQPTALATAEAELSTRLRTVLHHPDFQALEAAWRGVDLLMRRIESQEEIRLLILDISLAELQADLSPEVDPDTSALFRLLRDKQPNLLLGNFTFGQSSDDLRILRAIGDLTAHLSSTFVASAAPGLLGCESFADHPDPDDWTHPLPDDMETAWKELRDSAHAAHVGLTAPRFLLRPAYGKAGEPIDTFPFEELPGIPPHEAFLWSHGSTLIACTVIDAIQFGDTNLSDFNGGEVGEMPIHLFTQDGEKVAQCHAEAWLTERAQTRMLQRGVSPISAVKGSDRALISPLVSVAMNRTALRLLS